MNWRVSEIVRLSTSEKLMNKSIKFFQILSLVAIISGCGVKDDVEKSINKESTDNKIIAQDKINSIKEISFQSIQEKFDILPKFDDVRILGTREAANYISEHKSLINEISSYDTIKDIECKVTLVMSNMVRCQAQDYSKYPQLTFYFNNPLGREVYVNESIAHMELTGINVELNEIEISIKANSPRKFIKLQ